MDLRLSHYFEKAAQFYSSPSQIVRSVSESWARDNLYCPRCGIPLQQYPNNTQVRDFYCNHTNEEFVIIPSQSQDNFQLKTMKSFPFNYFPKKIVGSAYDVAFEQLNSGNFPSLILLHYERKSEEMKDGLLIHRLAIPLSSLQPRSPLSESAERKGWKGYEMLLTNIPQIGRIPLISQSHIVPKETVMEKWLSVETILRGDLNERSWISDILSILDRLPQNFSTDEIYSYQPYLERLHPNNRHIEEKIRQQLQILRDRGYVKFVSRGKYQKLMH